MKRGQVFQAQVQREERQLAEEPNFDLELGQSNSALASRGWPRLFQIIWMYQAILTSLSCVEGFTRGIVQQRLNIGLEAEIPGWHAPLVWLISALKYAAVPYFLYLTYKVYGERVLSGIEKDGYRERLLSLSRRVGISADLYARFLSKLQRSPSRSSVVIPGDLHSITEKITAQLALRKAKLDRYHPYNMCNERGLPYYGVVDL